MYSDNVMLPFTTPFIIYTNVIYLLILPFILLIFYHINLLFHFFLLMLLFLILLLFNFYIALATLTDFTSVSLTTLQLVLLFNNNINNDFYHHHHHHHYEINMRSKLLECWLSLLNSSKGDLNAATLNSISQILDKKDESYLIFDTVDENNNMTAIKYNDNVMEDRETEKVVDDTLNIANTNKNNDHSKNYNDISNDYKNNRKIEVIKLKKFILDVISDIKNVNITNYLLKLATMPISSTRHAAVNLMRSIALQPTGWGLQLLFQTTTTTSSSSSYNTNNNKSGTKFYDYLFNRHTEYAKDGKDFKFALIQAIYHNPSKIHLSQEINDKIQSMIQQGAYYLTPRTADPQLMEN